jgi:hypothetical protein
MGAQIGALRCVVPVRVWLIGRLFAFISDWRCRIEPFLRIKAPLRAAAPGIARGGLRSWGADPQWTGYPDTDPHIRRLLRQHSPRA